MTWKSFIDKTYINGAFYSVCLKSKIAIAVGENSPRGVIIMGKR